MNVTPYSMTYTMHLHTGGADFVPLVKSIMLTGVSPGGLTPFNVSIVNDFDVEPEKSFTLLLSLSSPGTLINMSIATVTIVDDDGKSLSDCKCSSSILP